MSPTDTVLWSGKTLLERQKNRWNMGGEVVKLANTGKLAYVQYSSASDTELAHFVKALRSIEGQEEKWCRRLVFQGDSPDDMCSEHGPGRLPYPTVVLSAALGENILPQQLADRFADGLSEMDLRYLCLIEGEAGSLIQKLIIRGSREKMSHAIFYHLANGYSVIFVGLTVRRHPHALGSWGARSWVRCETMEELHTVWITAEATGKVPIIC